MHDLTCTCRCASASVCAAPRRLLMENWCGMIRPLRSLVRELAVSLSNLAGTGGVVVPRMDTYSASHSN